GSRLAIPFVGYEYELFARNAKKIAVDIDHRELEKNTIKLDIPINSDVKFFIKRLMEKLDFVSLPPYDKWLGKCQDWKARYYDVPEGLSEVQQPVSSYNLFNVLTNILDDESIVIADAG